jgi:hypothetical protein
MLSFTPQPLNSLGKNACYPLDRRLGGPQNLPETTWRGEKSCIYRDPNSDLSVVQHVASRYTDWGIPAPIFVQFKYKNFGVPWIKLRNPHKNIEFLKRQISAYGAPDSY